MRTEILLATSFLIAATVGGCDHQNDEFFFCKEGGRRGVVTAEEASLRVSLLEQGHEIWFKVAPRDELEDSKNIAKAYCTKAIVPPEVAP